MSLKHYREISQAFSNVRLRYPGPGGYDIGFNDGVSAAANELAGTLARENPKFDRAKFLKACGVSS